MNSNVRYNRNRSRRSNSCRKRSKSNMLPTKKRNFEDTSENSTWDQRCFSDDSGQEWVSHQIKMYKTTLNDPNEFYNVQFSSLNAQPSHRINRSLNSSPLPQQEHTNLRRAKSVNFLITNTEGDIYFTKDTAKRLEAFRLNEEMWFRHVFHLSEKTNTLKNKHLFWRHQIRGFQKKDFKPISRIAEGNYMKVFAVFQKKRPPDINGALAMKVLERIEFQEEEIIKEFEIMLKLSDSDHFPTLYGFFFDRQNFQMCYVMEFLNGICMMTLTYAILHPPKEQHPDYLTIAEFYTAEMVRALSYLHHLINVPHGDLKNDNVMICMNGRLKIFDFDYCGQYSLYHHSERFHRYDSRKHQAVRRYFKKELRSLYPECFAEGLNFVDIFRVQNLGMVREHERRLKVRALSGHRAYRSPEYHIMDKKGELISRKRAMMSDWWSVGVLSYEMFMGIHPFAKKDPSQTYPRFRCMNINDVIKHEIYPPLSHAFIAARCGEKVALLLRCFLTSERNRLGRVAMGADICARATELGFKYFGSETFDPPFRPRVMTVEEIAESDHSNANSVAKSYGASCKQNKSYSGFSFLAYSAF